MWACEATLGLMFYSPLPLAVSPEQQSVHAKEATEDMEVAILKTCQSVSDLRREVSSSPSVTETHRHDCDFSRWMFCLYSSFLFLFTSLPSLCQLNYVVVSPLLLSFHLRLLTIFLPPASLLFSFCHLIFGSSSSSTRWRSVAPRTCSKFTGSSCLCGHSKLQAPRATWRQWRSIRARSPSRRSSWWR